jgi:hypothetical protein
MNPGPGRTLRVLLGLMLLVILLVSASIAAFLVWGLPELLGIITIDDHVLAAPGNAHAGHWLLATAGVLIAALTVLLVVPVAIAFGVLSAAFGLVAALSPLLLVGALAVWLWRRSATPSARP